MMTTILTREDIAQIAVHVGLDPLMDRVIDTLRLACADFDATRTEVRLRDGFTYQPPHVGVLEWMPVMSLGESVVVKMVSYSPWNPARYRVPTIISTISLYDLQTGHLVALADGTFATALRTGAASAVASSILAHPTSEVVGLVGCGAQAVTQLHALSRLFDIKRVLIYDTDERVSASFAARCDFLGLNISMVSRRRLEAESDIICTTTSIGVGAGPVIDDETLKPWVHINAVGSDLPGKIELPLSLLRRSLVCPDYLAQALVEGECQQLQPEEVGPSLIDLVKNSREYRHRQLTETVFDSTGFALEDKVVMEVLISLAHELGVGRSMPIESIALDPMDPYGFISECGALPVGEAAQALRVPAPPADVKPARLAPQLVSETS
jgi:ornithine cyclodeaminase